MQSSPIDIASHLLSWLPLFILYVLNGFMRSKTKKHLFIDCSPLQKTTKPTKESKNMKATKHYMSWSKSKKLPMLKFIYSEKATKFSKIFPLLLTVVKSKGKISQNFVAFSEYMNFTSRFLTKFTCNFPNFSFLVSSGFNFLLDIPVTAYNS